MLTQSRQRTREASRIAAEIEGQAVCDLHEMHQLFQKSASNIHLAEERGMELDIDEEERLNTLPS